MCNPHLETTWRKKSSHFQGTGSTQQESNYLLSFILCYHSYYFSKNCMVEPHHMLLDNEKNLKYCSKRTYHGSSWSTSLESWKPYTMIRNSAFVYSASTIQGWDEWPYLCLRRLPVQFSRSVLSNFLWPHGLQHARLPCPSPTPEACSNHVHWVSDAIQPLSSPLLLPLIFPSIRVFSSESVLHTRCPKFWSFSFNWVTLG